MSRSRNINLVASLVLVLALAAQAIIVRAVDNAHTWTTVQETLYISSPKLLNRLSLGYEGLLADIYWTRVVQYFGGKHREGGGTYKLLAPLLTITTQLDPRLIPAYEFGSMFLVAKPPDGAGEPEKAIELVRHGIQNNPGDWHLYYDLAFIYYDQKDYRDSAEAFLQASRLPRAHPFLKIMAAQMAEHGGDLATARMMWSATYETTRDPMIRANAAAHLRAIQADEEVTLLENVVETYTRRTGKVPASFSKLVSAGFLREVPVDPTGHPYRLDSGKVVVSDPQDLPFLEKGVPDWYVPPSVPKLGPAK